MNKKVCPECRAQVKVDSYGKFIMHDKLKPVGKFKSIRVLCKKSGKKAQ